jgi:hypothetical protein
MMQDEKKREGADESRFVVDGAESELGILDLIQVCSGRDARLPY